MPFDDRDTLLDMAESLTRLAKMVSGHTFDSFLDDMGAQAAVQYWLIVTGEAVKRLSGEFREAHPGVAWQEIAGNRDVLIHGYDRVDLQLVWETATIDARAVLDYIRPLLPSPEE